MSKESKGFMYSDSEINVLKSFSQINASMILNPGEFSVINNSKSVIGEYKFEKEYDYESFGIYEASEFLTALGAMDKPVIEVDAKSLTIIDGEAKLKYFTTAKDLLPAVPDVGKKFATLDCELDFTISADKLAFLLKMATILKSKYLFFETEKKKIRITAGDELTNSSSNNYAVDISEGIKANKLDGAIKIVLADFKIMPGAYEVKLSSKISRWTGTNGVVYYIGTAA